MNRLFFLLILLIPCRVFAQKGINDFIQDSNYTYSDFNNVLVQNDTIITFGINRAKFGNRYISGLYLTKKDTNGLTLQSKFIIDKDSLDYSVTPNYGNIIKTSQGTFVCIAPNFNFSVIFTELDNDFKILQTKYFQDTTLISNFDYKIVEAKDGYLLYGSVYRKLKNGTPPWLPLGFVRKIDREGNTEWLKYYNPVSYDNDILDMKVINDQ